ncbi:MAG: NADH-quinone oxidoreductase subunit N [Acidimicrobiales bacterium]|nr:NADH-quinone oxidoreductase subunit N [Acidimicrobiales bacterium]
MTVLASVSTLSSVAQAAQDDFARPAVDWHALAPDLVVVGVLCLVLVADLFLPDDRKALLPSLAGLGLLGALIPVLTLAVDGADRTMFGGAYAVDNFALVLKALFLVAGYIVVLQSTNYIAEGDYAEGEYYFLLLASILGMTIMASARDLITIFVALELLSIPAYLLAGWRKRDPKGNEAGVKYYLMGVFATGILLYGMSLVYGVAGTTQLAGINEALTTGESVPLISLALVLIIGGFAFKVSAVPFHTWAPDTYEGAPTPITAFLSVSSKAAGFVALLQLIVIGFAGQTDVVRPLVWVLAVLSMTIGNLVALRQTNLVRMLAYSGISQAGFILAPLAVVGQIGDSTVTSVVTYLLIYSAMNLGAFTVVMAVARKTGSAEITSFGGLINYAPSLAVLMTVFMFALAGIPPLAGWLAKFVAFRAVIDADTPWAYTLAVVMAVNTVVSLAYYANVAREMWMNPAPDGDEAPVRVPVSLTAALTITGVLTIAFGVTQWATELGDMANFVASATP